MLLRSITFLFLALVISACTNLSTTQSNGSTISSTPEKAIEQPIQTILSTSTQETIADPTATKPAPTPTSDPTTASVTATEESNPTATQPVSIDTTKTDAIIIDHSSVALFDSIPAEYLEAARNLHMMYADRSVGQNINEALNCLSATSWAKSPAPCRNDYYNDEWNFKTFKEADLAQGTVPDRISFDPDPQVYSRNNWIFEPHMGSWSELTQDFIQNLAPKHLSTADVLSYQLSYLNVLEGDNIADPTTGFFSDNPNRYDIYDLEAFIAQHPDKIFIFWTTSLARGIGTQVSTDFNNMMRQYAIDHDKILFDVADIESHTDLGVPCYDNRDGVDYCSQNGQCESHPDDGLELPAICQDWTTESDGGHLGSVSGGGLSLAKALWVLMARIAGWDGTPQSAP